MPRRKRSWSFSRRKKQVKIDEGYVKFSLSMTDGDVPKHPDWEKLNEARGTLHQLGLIGTYANGIGFGNASMRNSGLEFIITGTATGGIPILKEDDYCLVQSFELEKNHVRATGRTKASSESMTHGAIYSADESIRCVLHFHSRKILSTLPVWSLLFSYQPIKKIELIHSHRGHYLATIPFTERQNDPRLENDVTWQNKITGSSFSSLCRTSLGNKVFESE